MNSKQQIKNLQIIRAFAAILVAAHHWFDNIAAAGFGVHVFFILSGFLMILTQKDTKGPKKFISDRIIRIFPIYIILSFPFIIGVAHKEHQGIGFILGNVFLLPSFINDPQYRMVNAPAWTLVYEMLFYYIFSICLLFIRDKKWLAISITVVLGLLVGSVDVLHIQQPLYGWVNLGYMVGDKILLCFVAGCLLALLYEKYRAKISFSFSMFCFSILLCYLMAVWLSWQWPHYDRIFSFGIPGVILIFVGIFSQFKEGSLPKKIVFLGDMSYSVYVAHILIYRIANIVLGYFHVDKSFFVLVMVFIVMLCISGSIYVYIEQPVTKYLKSKFR